MNMRERRKRKQQEEKGEIKSLKDYLSNKTHEVIRLGLVFHKHHIELVKCLKVYCYLAIISFSLFEACPPLPRILAGVERK